MPGFGTDAADIGNAEVKRLLEANQAGQDPLPHNQWDRQAQSRKHGHKYCFGLIWNYTYLGNYGSFT